MTDSSDLSSKMALRRVDQAVQELVTVMAREAQRPLVSNHGWVLCLDNRYYEGGELAAATISLVPQPNLPFFCSEMLIQNAFQGLSNVEYADDDEDVE